MPRLVASGSRPPNLLHHNPHMLTSSKITRLHTSITVCFQGCMNSNQVTKKEEVYDQALSMK